MEHIPIRELNQHTSAVLDLVAKGHAVVITRDGRPIARLVPIPGPSSTLNRWVSQGLAIGPTISGPFARPPRSDGTARDVASLLVRDREQERG